MNMAVGNIEINHGSTTVSAVEEHKKIVTIQEPVPDLSPPSSPLGSTRSTDDDDSLMKPKRRLRFSSTCRTKLVPHFNDYTKRQWSQIWYTEDEISFFMERQALKEEAFLLSSRRGSNNSRSSNSTRESPSPSLFGKKTMTSFMRTFMPSPASSTKSARSSLSSYASTDSTGSSEQTLPPPPPPTKGRGSFSNMLLGLSGSSLSSSSSPSNRSRTRSLSPSPAANRGGKGGLKAHIMAANDPNCNIPLMPLKSPTRCNDGSAANGGGASRPPMFPPTKRIPNGMSNEEPIKMISRPQQIIRRNVSAPDEHIQRRKYDRAPRRPPTEGKAQKPQRKRSESF